MAQNITIMGASYSDVPAVTLPKTEGGTARFDDTTDATASSDDIVSGESAYVDGRKINGSLVVTNYYTGSSVPSSSLGNDGDIYFRS